MQTDNNIDKHFNQQFKNRELQPSASAWERLSNQLDQEEQKNKKKWFFYVGYAASFALLLFAGYTSLNKPEPIIPVDDVIVNVPIDTIQFQKEIKQEAPIERAIVNIPKEVVSKRKVAKRVAKKKTVTTIKSKISAKDFIEADTKEKTVVAKVETTQKETVNKINTEELNLLPIKRNKTSKIKINADDLLYSVTHTKEEVKAYYAKNNLDRKVILKDIEKQLKKSKIKINPETILAEVEGTITEDTFKNKFLRNVKSKVSDLVVAFANRNK